MRLPSLMLFMLHLCGGVCYNDSFRTCSSSRSVCQYNHIRSSASSVGSYVWSHLTNVLRSEDPMKQPLIESLPDDIISRDFEAEFLKYSSYSDYTVSSGSGGFPSASI